MIVLPAKPIAIVLKEHKQRYGDATKNTAQKFQKPDMEETPTTPKERESESDSEEVIRAKVRVAWAELVANSSSGTGPVPTIFGNKPAGICIREITLDESLTHNDTPAYPMPFETYLNDEELAAYRKEQLWKEQAEYEDSHHQHLLTNSIPTNASLSSTKTSSHMIEIPSIN